MSLPRFVSTVAVLSITACTSVKAVPEVPKALAFVHATVVDVVAERLNEDLTVVVSGNRITSMTKSAAHNLPRGAQVIDVRGKYLIPGLWDMHVHAFTSPESTIALGARAVHVYFPEYLAAGVTGIRDMGGWLDTVMTIRARVRRHEILGPRIVAAGRLIGGRNPWAPPSPHSWVVTLPDSARAVVDSLKRAGADFIKVHDFLSRDVYFAVAAAARSAGLPLVGHLRPSVAVDEAVTAGQVGMEHMPIELIAACAGGGTKEVNDFYDRWTKGGWPEFVRATAELWAARKPNCDGLLARLREAGVRVTPTLVLRMQDSVFLRGVNVADLTPAAIKRCSEDVRDWGKTPDSLRTLYYNTIFDVVRTLQRAGVGLLAGTDGPASCLAAGSSLHSELEALVRAGLTPAQALRSATLEPALFMGLADSLGTISPGKVADMVLLDENPLAAISNVRRVVGVVVDGRWLNKQYLDSANEN